MAKHPGPQFEAETARQLKERAAADGASVNETARRAIVEYLRPDKAEFWARADAIRKKIGQVSGDSVKIIREWRDNNGRYR